VTEIEFLEPGPGPADTEPAPPAPWVDPAEKAARSLPAAVAAAFAVLASALCVAAAFQRLYGLRFGSGAGAVDIDVDARGRYSGTGSAAGGLQRAADYAAVLWMCATLFAALAVLCATTAVGFRHRLLPSSTLALGAAAAGLLAGLLLAARAQVQAMFETVRATLRFSARNGDPVNGQLATVFGPCLILGAVALVCAVAATATATAATRPRRQPRPRDLDAALPADPIAAEPGTDPAEEELRT
jgi:hypothetical protein